MTPGFYDSTETEKSTYVHSADFSAKQDSAVKRKEYPCRQVTAAGTDNPPESEKKIYFTNTLEDKLSVSSPQQAL